MLSDKGVSISQTKREKDRVDFSSQYIIILIVVGSGDDRL